MGVVNTKKNVSIDERCKSCFQNTYQNLFEKFNIEIDQRQEFNSFYQATIFKYKHLSTPEIQRELNNEFCKIINIYDPFKEEKINSNAISLDLYNEWKPKVFSSEDSFDLALRLAIAGNIMDYGANNSFDIHKTINSVLKASFAIDHSPLLRNKIQKAKSILYLGDNAGEIVFDKLFIETIMPNNVIYAVKGSATLNDATIEDAKAIGMDKVVDVISNGYNAPSTVLHKCSKEFLKIFNSADIIISKGQGNLEGLIYENDPRIFFLLMVKCDVIAEVLNVDKGSFVVYNQSIGK